VEEQGNEKRFGADGSSFADGSTLVLHDFRFWLLRQTSIEASILPAGFLKKVKTVFRLQTVHRNSQQ